MKKISHNKFHRENEKDDGQRKYKWILNLIDTVKKYLVPSIITKYKIFVGDDAIIMIVIIIVSRQQPIYSNLLWRAKNGQWTSDKQNQTQYTRLYLWTMIFILSWKANVIWAPNQYCYKQKTDTK